MIVVQQGVKQGIGGTLLKDSRVDLTEKGSWRHVLLHVRLLAVLGAVTGFVKSTGKVVQGQQSGVAYLNIQLVVSA